MNKQTIAIPGPNHIKLVLDPSDADTPAMVYGGKPNRDGLGRSTATYECAANVGELGDGEVVLTEAQIEFLDKDEIAEKVDAVFAAARLEGR